MSEPIYGPAHAGESTTAILERLGFKRVSRGNTRDDVVRVSDGHVMTTTRTSFDTNHWIKLRCPDMAGEPCSEPWP